MAISSMGGVLLRNEESELFVYPPSGIIYNIQNRGASCNRGNFMSQVNADLKQHFMLFHPERARVLGKMGVVTFKVGSEGLKDALAFEQCFIDKSFGRRDWKLKSSVSYPYGPGTDLYGWLARKEDFDCMGVEGMEGDAQKDGMEIAKHLKATGSYLRDVVMMNLDELQNKMTEREVEMFYTTEDIKLHVEERHKKELEEVKTRAQQSVQEQTQGMQEINCLLETSMEALTNEMEALKNEVKHLKDELKKAKDESDQEKNENHWRLDSVNQRNEMQKYHAHQVKLNKQREEQSKKLEEIFLQDRFLTEQHRLSLQSLGEITYTEELNDKLKSMEKQREEIEEQLVDLKIENDLCYDKINALTMAERTTNDELQEARKFAITEIIERRLDTVNIKVKRMGEIDELPWKMAYQGRHVSRDNRWHHVWKTKYSEWEARLNDHDFSLFKTIQIGEENKQERKVDWENEQLLALKFELGDEVCQSVVTAFTELEDYNASGRYPVPVLWNVPQNRGASLKEVMVEVMDPAMRRVKRRAPSRTPRPSNAE